MAMTPETAMIIASVLQAGQKAVAGGQQQNLDAANRAQQERQFASSQRQRQGEAALAATQMDPLLQQRSRQRSAGMEQLLRGLTSPTLNVAAGKFEGGAKWTPEMSANIASFFTPEARQNAEAQFGLNATAASGGQYAMPNAYPNVGNMGGVGYPTPAAAPGGTTTPMPTLPGMAGPTRPANAPGTNGMLPGARNRSFFYQDEDDSQTGGLGSGLF